MTTYITARHESITGADLSGSSGNSNRTYSLTYSDAQSAMFIINVQGTQLQQGHDFTLLSDTITFLNAIDDTDTIILDYFTGTGSLTIVSGYGYCETSDVYRTAGISDDVISVADVSNHILESETFICRYTKTVYWKTTLTNQTTTSATDNTITQTSAGWTTNDYQNQYVMILSGTGINQIRQITSNDTDTLTVDRDWETNPDSTSTFKIFYTPTDFNPYFNDQIDGSGLTYQYAPLYPVQIIESLSIASTDISISNIYLYKTTGKMLLKTTAEYPVFSKTYPQEIDLQYWYGVDSVPYDIKRLVMIKAAMSILQQQMGGTYNVPSTVSLPEMNVTIGQAYINIKTTLEELKKEYNELLSRVKIYPVFG